MSLDLHDYSTYLIRAETNLNELEQKLLNKQYEGAENNIEEIIGALKSTLAWIIEQGSDHAVDVAASIEKFAEKVKDTHSESVMLSAAREIRRLEGERAFWHQTGYDIGKADAKQE